MPTTTEISLLFYEWERPFRWYHYPMLVVSPNVSHVAVLHDRTVYSPRQSGCLTTPIEGIGSPFAICTFPVEHFYHYELTRGFGVFPSFVCWLTGGLIQAENCVTKAANLLRRGGVSVPRSVVTPDRLLDWAWENAVERHQTVPETNAEGVAWSGIVAEAEALAGTGGVRGPAAEPCPLPDREAAG